jgi:hypothetical protein
MRMMVMKMKTVMVAAVLHLLLLMVQELFGSDVAREQPVGRRMRTVTSGATRPRKRPAGAA